MNLLSKSKTSQQSLEKMEKNSKLISIIRESNGISELNKSIFNNIILLKFYRKVDIFPFGWREELKGFLAVCFYLASETTTDITGTWSVSVVSYYIDPVYSTLTNTFSKSGQGNG